MLSHAIYQEKGYEPPQRHNHGGKALLMQVQTATVLQMLRLEVREVLYEINIVALWRINHPVLGR